MIAPLCAPDGGLEAIEHRVRDAARAFSAEPKRACLIMNSSMELAPHDPEVAAITNRFIQDFKDGFAVALQVAAGRREKPELYDGTRYYSTTKAFSAWWSAAMTRRFGAKTTFYTVSPGSNMSTNAARHVTGFKRILFTKVMPAIGPLIGWDQPVHLGAKRYVDVLNDHSGEFKSGKTYTSAPKKMVGPLHEVTVPHLLDTRRQDVAFAVLSELTGTAIAPVREVSRAV